MLFEEDMPALLAFESIAEEYCAFIDSLRAGRPDYLYSTLESLLNRVHGAILHLDGNLYSDDHPEFEIPELTHEQWDDITNIIAEAAGKEIGKLFQWHVDIAGEVDENATRAGMIWDDLGGIYRDLHDGLTLCKIGTDDARIDAAWEWRFG